MHRTGLTARTLTDNDIPLIGWSGGAAHVRHVADALERARTGAVVYLAVVDGNEIVAVGGVDLTAHSGHGTLWQLAVRPARRSQGIGTFLVAQLEAAAVRAGMPAARLSVEDTNPDARRLYERLGYTAAGTEAAEWDEDDGDGGTRRHTAVCTVMTKRLLPAPDSSRPASALSEP